MPPRGKALLALGVLAVLAGFEAWRLGNPDPAPRDAPANAFSATRAVATLRAVSLDAPHPIGSPAHDVVRDRIAAHLRALDYDVDVQGTFACNAAAVCGTVDNIIATIPGGPRGGRRIAVVAHYDSVAAGPGASDDGTGVATALEIARAIRHEKLANPIAFLIDDGEEEGFLGAEGFLADPARSRDTAFIINLEARGTSGTPFLFETSRERRWLIPVVAGALPDPVTTSLFATVYELLPNDTDLTVFKRAGLAGINFAYLGDGTQYHTPLDSFANVDEGSIQRRGEQALAMVRAFGNAGLDAGAPEDAVWFDVFALFIVWWPASWSLAITVLALALLTAAIVLGVRRREVAVTGVLVGLGAFVAAIVLALGLGAALRGLLGVRAPGALFAPHAWPSVAAAWLLGIAAALAIGALARRRASFDALFAGLALAWNLAAVALALALPGAAYIAVVPGALMSCFALVRATVRVSEEIACLGSLIGAGAVFLPFALIVHDVLGPGSVVIVAAVLALASLSFAPMLAESARRLATALLAAAAMLGMIAALVPTTSPSHPLHLSLAHVTDASTGTARWQADAPTAAVRAVARFEPRPVSPWLRYRAIREVASAPPAGVAPPVVKAATEPRDGARVTTIDISSARGAPRLRIVWRSEAIVESLRINGVTPPPRPARFRSVLAPGWSQVVVWGAPARIEIVTRGAAPTEALVSDASFGLPPSAAALIRARDASGAVPVHDGDLTVVEQRVTW